MAIIKILNFDKKREKEREREESEKKRLLEIFFQKAHDIFFCSFAQADWSDWISTGAAADQPVNALSGLEV